MLISLVLVLAYITAFATFPAFAWASNKPASTKSLFAGPYIIDVNLYQDPPVTDQPSEITVVPHEESLQLYGRILMVPGLGTDAVELHSKSGASEPDQHTCWYAKNAGSWCMADCNPAQRT